MNTVIAKLGGRKFIAAISTVITVVLSSVLGMSEDVVQLLVATGIAYIGVQGAVDGMTNGATSSTTPNVDPAELARIQLAVELEKTKQAKVNAKAPGAAPVIEEDDDAKVAKLF